MSAFDYLDNDEMRFLNHLTSGEDDAAKAKELFRTISSVFHDGCAPCVSPYAASNLAICATLAVKEDRNEHADAEYWCSVMWLFEWFMDVVVEAVRKGTFLWENEDTHEIWFFTFPIPEWLLEKCAPKERI